MGVSNNKGFYKPLNEAKWRGDIHNIVFRSALEFKIFRYLESLKNVNAIWSEEVVIPYKNPIDNRLHRYYPDLLVQVVDKSGKKQMYLIEIKPYNETIPPRKTKRMRESTYTKMVMEYLKNQAKWSAAKQYCKQKGWQFIILTEKDL